MRFLTVALIGIIAASISHSETPADPDWLVAAGSGNPAVSAFLEVHAEFVTVTVTISSSNDKALARATEIEETRRRLISAAQEDTSVSLSQGAISVSPQDHASSLLGSKYGASSDASIYLSVALSDNLSPFEATRRVHHVLLNTELSGKARLSVSPSMLAIRDPESYRDRLLELVAQQAASLKERFGPGTSVTISGLEQKVQVSAKGAETVTVSLPYSLTVNF